MFLLDDTDTLQGSAWEVAVRVYDSRLRIIRSETYRGSGSIDRVRQVGTLKLSADETDTSPLLTVVDVRRNNALAQRSYYWSNFEHAKDSLFNLPETKLSLQVEGNTVLLENTGSVPAVAAHVLRPGHLDSFTADDNYFWLDPGESKKVTVSDSRGLVAGALNVPDPESESARPSNEASGVRQIPVPLPPMGWSSWNSFSNTVNSDVIMQQAKALVSSGARKADYEYVNIDEGWWLGERDRNGNILVDPKSWPALAADQRAGDMSNIVKYIHSLGLKAGIYTDAGAAGCGHYAPDLGLPRATRKRWPL